MAQERDQELGELNGITENMKKSAVVFLNAAQSLANTHTATLVALNGVTGSIKSLTASQQDVMRAVQNVSGRIGGMPPSGVAESPRTDVALMIEQQRALQEALRKIESLIAAQQQGMDKLLSEQRSVSRGMPAHPAGATAPSRNVDPSMPPPPETSRKA